MRRILLALLAIALAGSAHAQILRPGSSLGVRGGFQTAASGPLFDLSQLPAGARAFDLDAASGVTAPGSAVESWVAKAGTLTVGTSVAAEKPTLVADGWSTGVPVVRFNGLSSGSILRSSTGALVLNRWTMGVAARAGFDQNAVATYKVAYETGRPSDGLSSQLLMQRVAADTSQNTIYAGRFGDGGPTGLTTFPKGARILLTDRADGLPSANSKFVLVNGVTSGSPSLTPGTATRAQRKIGGSDDAVSARAALDLARLVEFDTDQLPGRAEQVANRWLLEGHLAWRYGLQASLPADNPFLGRAPLASDYTGNNRLVAIIGNSLANGIGGQLSDATAYNPAARGLTVTNLGVGGQNSAEIKTRFDALSDDFLKRVFVIGDVVTNDANAGIPIEDTRARIDAMIARIESVQGLGVGKAHIRLLPYWLGNGAGSEPAGFAALNSGLATSYPAYFVDPRADLVAQGAPGGASPDPTAYAAGKPPAAYRAADGTHLVASGYLREAVFLSRSIESVGWHR